MKNQRTSFAESRNIFEKIDPIIDRWKDVIKMPVFYFLVLLSAVALWFLASGLFRPMGTFFRKVYRDAKDNINETDEGEKEHE